MSPRAFDPMQRALDFPRMPSPRRQMFTMTAERQAQAAMRLAAAAVDYAVQPTANTPIEIVHALPEATAEDIGRQVIVQLPGQTVTSIYVGILLPDSTIVWQLMAVGESTPTTPTGPAFAFQGSVAGFGGAPRAVVIGGAYIWYGIDGNTSLRKYLTSSGTTSLAFTGWPTGTSNKTGLAYDFPRIYAALPTTDALQGIYTDGTGANAVGTADDYADVTHRGVDGKLYACTAATGRVRRVEDLTMAHEAIVLDTADQWSGIAHDAAGDAFYLVSLSPVKVVKYSNAWVLQWSVGSSGSGNNQLSSPRGLDFENGIVYVADSGNNRIAMWDSSGVWIGSFGSPGTTPDPLSSPQDISVVGTSIAVADFGNSRLSLWLRTT